MALFVDPALAGRRPSPMHARPEGRFPLACQLDWPLECLTWPRRSTACLPD